MPHVISTLYRSTKARQESRAYLISLTCFIMNTYLHYWSEPQWTGDHSAHLIIISHLTLDCGGRSEKKILDKESSKKVNKFKYTSVSVKLWISDFSKMTGVLCFPMSKNCANYSTYDIDDAKSFKNKCLDFYILSRSFK